MHKFALSLLILFLSFGILAQNQFPSNESYKIMLSTEIFLPSEKTSNDLRPPSKSEEAQFFNENYFRLIQFYQIPNAAQRKLWAAQGLQLRDYVPNKAYFAVIQPSFDLATIADKIRAVLAVDHRFKLEAELYHRGIPEHAIDESGQIHLVLSYYDGINVEDVLTRLITYGTIKEHRTYSRQIDLAISNLSIEEIADLAFVQFLGTIDPLPTLERTYWRGTGRTNYLSSNFNGLNFTGDGVTIAVGEGGAIGSTNPDYKGRITEMSSGSSGHKFGVSRRAAGAGNINPIERGCAPGSDFLSVGSSPNYANLFTTNNLRFTNHSLGYGISGGYSSTTRNFDLFVLGNKEAMVQYSAGNSGGSTGFSPYNSFSGWGNLTGQRKQFKNNLLAASSNSLDIPTGFSSRGPTYDGRLAPHLIIEGGGGTSHAAPKMIGNFAVLSEVYTNYNATEAESSLLKAILMNTADDLGNEGIDFVTGYGRVNMRRAHDLIQDGNIIEDNVDQGNNDAHVINVPANTLQLRVLIYWADQAAAVNATTALVNDLDLSVTDPNTTNHLPWVLDHSPNTTTLNALPTQQVDHLNNVEQVTIDNPTAGNYTINVSGFNVPSGPQDYFVVYEFLEAHLQITDPIKDRRLVPNEDFVIYWDSYGSSTSDFTLQYQANGGTWTTIGTTDFTKRTYSWTPASFGTEIQSLKIRVMQDALISESDLNTIGAIPQNVSLVWRCADRLKVQWDAVVGATDYKVYLLGAKFMEEKTSDISFDGTSAVINGLSTTETIYYAVAAVTNTNEGRRSNALSVAPGNSEINVPASLALKNKNVINCSDEEISYQLLSCSDNDMTITAPTGFQISTTSGSGFTNSLVLSPVSGEFNQTIYVRLNPANGEGSYSGDITHNTLGLAQQNISMEPRQILSIDNKANNALEALEANEHLIIENLNWSAPTNFTIEWWLKPYTFNNWNQQIGNGWGDFLFHANSDGSVSAGVSNNSSRINSLANTLELNQWQHFAFVKSGNNFTLYRNGVVLGTSTSSSNVTWSSFIIGDTGSHSINGQIDEFRMWTTARSTQEIRENMHLSLTGNETGLRVYLQFLADAGNVVDFSPNCYSVTNNNSFARTNSDLAVAGGVAVSKSVTSAGNVSFDNGGNDTNLDINFGLSPNGDVTVSHLLAEAPHGTAPVTSFIVDSDYWIIHNYGSVNTGLSANLVFDMPNGYVTSSSPSDYEIFKRGSLDIGAWSAARNPDQVDAVNDILTFKGNSGFSQFILAQTVVLPVELTKFTAQLTQNKMVQLNWSTASELNNKGFEIQRSTAQTSWENIAWVAGKGDTPTGFTYAFLDREVDAGKIYYYRLRQLDWNGSFSYSDIRSVVVDQNISLSIHPNPVKDKLFINVEGINNSHLEFRIFNAIGQEVQFVKKEVNKQNDQFSIDVRNLASGVYWISFLNEESKTNLQFVK